MARQGAPELLSRLVDKGEEALQRVADAPGAHRMLETVTTLRSRVDDLQKRMRGLDALEQRVATLEKQVDGLTKKPAPAAKPAARKPAAAKTTGTTKKKTARGG